jgi:hypothetical protein
MLVYGVCMVRDEVDVIRVNVLYHLSAGIDRLLVVDNGSSDGTDEELERLAADPRVRWSRDEGRFHQGEVFTYLARQAYREGADWVVPIDADEFWFAESGGLRSVLADSEAGVLRVKTVDFIQRFAQEASSPEGLLHMTRRVPEPVARENGNRERLGAHEVSYVELSRVQKVVCRPSAEIGLVKGAHRATGITGPARETDGLTILHAPLRSMEGLQAKAASTGRRGPEGSTMAGPGWHARRWRKLQEEGRLEREWAANSYSDGCLDVYGSPHPVIFDPRLRDAVSPFIGDLSSRSPSG